MPTLTKQITRVLALGSRCGAEHADVGDADRARIEHGRDARADAADVRVDAAHADARRRGAVGHVGVDVDQARHDVAAVALHLDDAPASLAGMSA